MKRLLQRRDASDSSARGAGCLILFALPFAAVGVGCLYLTLAHLAGWWSARGWTPVPAKIESVGLESSTSDGSTTYRATATYRYSFAGSEYVGSRVSLSSMSDNLGSFHEDAHAALRRRRDAGEPWTAFVDPDDPSEALLFREARWGLVGFWLLFVVLFGGVGFGLLAAIPLAKRHEEKEARLRELHPDEPWKWNDAWQGPTIRSSARAAFVGPALMALVWNAISWPAVIGAWDRMWGEDPALLFVLLFPAVGLGLLFWALKALVRWRVFGSSELVLSEMPVRRGGNLVATVLTGALVHRSGASQNAGRVGTVRLTCTRDSSDSDSQRKLIWQEELDLLASDVRTEPTRTVLGVRLPIPNHVPQTEAGEVTWQLETTVERRGVDYHASFEIPVYGRAPAGEQAASPRRAPRVEPVAESACWEDRGVRIVPHDGGHHYVFRRARQKRAALGTTAFALVWTAILVGLILGSVPLPIVLGFGFFELFVVYFLLDMWLMRREVVAGPNGLAWRRGFLRMGRSRSVPASAVGKLDVQKGMQVGNKLFYRLLLRTPELRNAPVLADKLESASQARELAGRIRRDLGLGDVAEA